MRLQRAKQILDDIVTSSQRTEMELLEIQIYLKMLSPDLQDLSLYELDGLWRAFIDTHAAGFRNIDVDSINDFIEWLS